MDLRQLEQFVAVAELRSFTQAARRLHVVQSGVSATVAALERELGAPLFDRGRRGVRLTPAGAALLPEARTTLDAARAAKDAVARVTAGIVGDVRLGTITSMEAVDLPALLGRLRRDHPGITVRLSASSQGSAGLVELLHRSELDVAVLGTGGDPVPGLRITPLSTAPIVALLRDDHPLAGRASLTLTDLAGEPFIDFPPGYGNRRIVDEAFSRLGLTRSVVLEVADAGGTAGYVHHGLGVSLVPSTAAPGGDVVAVPVRPALPWMLSVAVPASRRPSAATQTLLDLVPLYIRGSTGSSVQRVPE